MYGHKLIQPLGGSADGIKPNPTYPALWLSRVLLLRCCGHFPFPCAWRWPFGARQTQRWSWNEAFYSEARKIYRTGSFEAAILKVRAAVCLDSSSTPPSAVPAAANTRTGWRLTKLLFAPGRW